MGSAAAHDDAVHLAGVRARSQHDGAPRVLAVLLASPTPPTTGLHLRYVANLRLLRELGCETHALVFTTADRPLIAGDLEDLCDGLVDGGSRVEYADIPLPRRITVRAGMALAGLARRPSTAYPFSLSYDLARAAERLDAAVEALRPDAVLLPTSLVHLAPRLTAQGVAVIGDAVDVQSQLSRRLTAYGRRAPWRWLGLFGNHLAIREQERRYLGECSELWATTEGEATILRRLAPRAVVVVAGNTVDGAAVRPAPLRPDGPIGFIGTYSYTPNLDAAEYLADHVMPRVRRALPGARLSLAGAGMPVDVAQRLAARDGIDVLGPVADPIRFVTSCSLMAMPIRLRGGVPLKLVEALACGRPVVATPELVAGLALVDGQDLLVANNASGLAASIVRLLTDPDLADRIATHGRDSFDRDLSLDASLGRLRAESLLSNRPSQ